MYVPLGLRCHKKNVDLVKLLDMPLGSACSPRAVPAQHSQGNAMNSEGYSECRFDLP